MAKKERVALFDAREHYGHVLRAQEIVQTVAQGVQEQAHEAITSVVSHCLAAVFGEDAYKFRIHFDRKRGRTEARMVFVKGENELTPESGSGGGAMDVASFALRLSALLLSRPSPRRLLVMDEPFKWLHSPIYRERAREMLERLAEQMDFQFIITTGEEEYHVGKIIDLEKL